MVEPGTWLDQPAAYVAAIDVIDATLGEVKERARKRAERSAQSG